MTTALPGLSVTPCVVAGTSCLRLVIVATCDGSPVRPSPEAFERGHLPGAVSFDLDRDLARPGLRRTRSPSVAGARGVRRDDGRGGDRRCDHRSWPTTM